MIRFFITRPAVVTLLMILVVVTGILSLSTMTVELWPPVEINQVAVQTYYPGASPEEVEKLLTVPLEDELEGLEDLDYLQSSSQEGLSSIDVVFLGEVPEAEMDNKTRDVQQRVNRVTDLPDEATTPQVIKIATENMPVAIFALSGPFDELELKHLSEDLEDLLNDLPGMKKVWITGTRDREVAVTLDPNRMLAYQLTADEVRTAIARRHVNFPAGTILAGRSETLLRVLGKPEELQGLGEIVVRNTPNGPLQVEDVAEIEDTFKDAQIVSHLNGRRSVLLMCAKERLARTTTLIDGAKEVGRQFHAVHPRLEIATVYDTSVGVRQRMKELVRNGIQGFFLVLVILWFNLGLRRGLIVALGIPISFLATFTIMRAFGISLNFMTLFGMFIVLGILVDDAIVVVENITRRMESGEKPRQAALRGTQQVAMPVVIAVSTTIVAFSTMLIMKGVMGRFMAYLPRVVMMVLGFSLIESLLLAPSHIAEWVPPETESGRQHRLAGRWLDAVGERLGQLLEGLLKHPFLSFCLPPIILFVIVMLASMHMQVEMFPAEEPEQLYISFELPAGSNLDATEAVAYRVEREVMGLKLPDVQEVYAAVGYGMNEEVSSSSRKNRGQVILVLADRSVREQSGFETAEYLREQLQGKYAGLTYLRVTFDDSGPPGGAPVHVRILGDDFGVLEDLAAEIKAFVAAQDGTINIDDDRDSGNPELQIRIDEEKVARSGVEFSTLAVAARSMFIGAKATERRIEEDNVDITVRGPQHVRRAREALANVSVPSVTGAPVPLLSLVEVTSTVGPQAVHRRDGEHSVTVTAEVKMGPDGPLANATAINHAIAQQFEASIPQRYPGYSIEFGGEAQEQAESFGSLGIAFIAAMLVIYGLLVLQFNTLSQPFVIMFTVPMTFVGVALGMFIFGERFSLSHGIGIVALVGIAVNGRLGADRGGEGPSAADPADLHHDHRRAVADGDAARRRLGLPDAAGFDDHLRLDQPDHLHTGLRAGRPEGHRAVGRLGQRAPRPPRDPEAGSRRYRVAEGRAGPNRTATAKERVVPWAILPDSIRCEHHEPLPGGRGAVLCCARWGTMPHTGDSDEP